MDCAAINQTCYTSASNVNTCYPDGSCPTTMTWNPLSRICIFPASATSAPQNDDWGGQIGEFVGAGEVPSNAAGSALAITAGAAPGAAWLMHPQPPNSTNAPSRDAVRAVVRFCRASRPPFAAGHVNLPPLATPTRKSSSAADIVVVEEWARRALIKSIDAAWAAAAAAGRNSTTSPPPGSGSMATNMWAASSLIDFKLLLAPKELHGLITRSAARDLEGTLACVPDAIAIRRTTATGRWIGFHCDAAARTLQVPLLDDGDCVGGRFLRAREDGALEVVPRRAGVPMVHDGGDAHGVTALTAGVRYGLFLICE